MNDNRIVSWTIVGVFAVCLTYFVLPKGDARQGFQYHRFATLPIQQGGRVKPIDTLARGNLLIVSHRQSMYEDKIQYPASKWLLDVLTTEMRKDGELKPEEYDNLKITIVDQAFIKLLGMEQSKDDRYKLITVFPRLRDLLQRSEALRMSKDLTPIQQEMLSFIDRQMRGIQTQVRLKFLLARMTQPVIRIEHEEVLNTLGLEPRSGFRYKGRELVDNLDVFLKEAARAGTIDAKNRNLYEAKLVELMNSLQILGDLARARESGRLAVVPPANGDPWRAEWTFLGQAEQQPIGQYFDQLLEAYAKGDQTLFNTVLFQYQQKLDAEQPGVLYWSQYETYFNETAPFYNCMILYVFAALLGCFSWLFWFRTLNRAAFWSTAAIFAVHTWALLLRMIISGRPAPVTNLYSSAIFIGWGCVGVCLLVEYLYKNGLPLICGNVAGALSLFVAHNLGISGEDTLEPLQAVLDTNFWLATHVTCITFGYVACFVAGMMGIAYIMIGLFSNSLRGQGASDLSKAIYGVVCFGMFLSFTGTVLGGIWADQSWGRFWGWDPKENGALLIVLWNALILHARWGGMVRHRGIAVLAVLGNIITAWSWFGVNMLGVGLHSYGFMAGAFFWLMAFVLTQLIIAGVGAFVPLSMWASFAPRKKLPAASPDNPTPGNKMELVNT